MPSRQTAGEPPPGSPPPALEQLAKGDRRGMLAEYRDFLRVTRKWWLGPILIMLLLFAALLAVGGGPAAAVLYTLF